MWRLASRRGGGGWAAMSLKVRDSMPTARAARSLRVVVVVAAAVVPPPRKDAMALSPQLV